MKLTQLMKEIVELQKVAATDIETIDFRSRPGWIAKKNQAGQQLENLVKTYTTALPQSAAGIFLTGDSKGIEETIDMAQDMANVFVVDAADLYTRVSLTVLPAMGHDSRFNANQAARIIEDLKDLSISIGVTRLQDPALSKYINTHLTTSAMVVDVVRKACREVYGDDLNAHYLENQVGNQAIAQHHDSDMVVVLVRGATEDLDGLKNQLFSGNNHHLKVGKKAKQSDLVSVFKKIRAKVTGEPAQEEAVQTEPTPETN